MQHHEEKRNAYWALVEKSEGKRLFGRPRCRWEGDIIKWILDKLDGVVWTGLI
jgi:hypothetical protein